MSFAFPKVEAETGVPITGRNASFTDYLGLKFTIGAGQTAGRAITGFLGDIFDDSELLDPKRANELYGNPDTGLVFDEPIREERARAMQERHDLNSIAQAELDTMQNSGWAQLSAGFVAQMVGGMAHPVDFSMNFIPFVGQAKLVKAGAGPLSQAMTRGLLISEETIVKHVTYPRLTAAVIDATAGNILAEIPVALDARRNKEEYSAEDFAFNIVGGTAIGMGFGAIIKSAYKGTKSALGYARESYSKLTPDIQDRMLKDAIQQVAVGKSPDVHSHATIDPKLMEAEWKEREAAIRAAGIPNQRTARPSGFNPPDENVKFNTMDDVLNYREAYQKAQIEFFQSLGLNGKDANRLFRSQDSRSGLDVSKIEAKLTDENYARLEAFSTGEGASMYQWDQTYDPTQIVGMRDRGEISRAIVLNLQRESTPNEFGDKLLHAVSALRQLKEVGGGWVDVAKELDAFAARNSSSAGDKSEYFVSLGKKIKAFADAQGIKFSDDVNATNAGPVAIDPDYQAFVKERIDKYVAEQKKLFDVEYQKKLAVSEAARVKQDIGPLAKPEDIAKLDGTRVPEAAVADLAEDARALSADAEADLKVLEVEDPELAAHIRQKLKEQMDVVDSPEPKAIEAAMRCLINE